MTIRLDPKLRFALDYLARFRGQTLTKIIEDAVYALADSEVDFRQLELPGMPFTGYATTWRDYWDPDEGIRVIRLVVLASAKLTTAEERLRAFVHAHEPFFLSRVEHYDDQKQQATIRPLFEAERIHVLWPRIEEYMALWESTRATDRHAAGRAMKEAIANAGVRAPDWPPTGEADGTGQKPQKPQPRKK